MILNVDANFRLWAYYLASASDVPQNGASAVLRVQTNQDNGVDASWSGSPSSEDIRAAITMMAARIEPKPTRSWSVLAQYAFKDEGDKRVATDKPQASKCWYSRATGLPAQGAIRVLYRRTWWQRLLGLYDVRVQEAVLDAGEYAWHTMSPHAMSLSFTRIPLPSDRDVLTAMGDETSMGLPPIYAPQPLAAGYTLRVDTTSTDTLALWVLLLVWHGYMTRHGLPTERFTATAREASK